MKVRMLTLMASPKGVTPKGAVIEVTDKEAKELINGKYAEAAETPSPKKAKKKKE